MWRWRNQYRDVLGGLGTGIGEGDRGVICGREDACCSAKEKEQETDCDAEDALQQAKSVAVGTPTSQTLPVPLWASSSTLSTMSSSSQSASSSQASFDTPVSRRTPSPALGPGYDRHEIEGIGGVVKRKLVKMVRVGACVPEWEGEKARGEILPTEVDRSWCGWCWRVIPGKKDYENCDKSKDEESS